MDELVEKLSHGTHLVVAARSKSAMELKEAIDRGFVLVKFPETRGGTELGVPLDASASDLSQADFAAGQGRALLRGRLTLNFQRVELSAMIDLKTLGGEGSLRVISDGATA